MQSLCKTKKKNKKIVYELKLHQDYTLPYEVAIFPLTIVFGECGEASNKLLVILLIESTMNSLKVRQATKCFDVIVLVSNENRSSERFPGRKLRVSHSRKLILISPSLFTFRVVVVTLMTKSQSRANVHSPSSQTGSLAVDSKDIELSSQSMLIYSNDRKNVHQITSLCYSYISMIFSDLLE